MLYGTRCDVIKQLTMRCFTHSSYRCRGQQALRVARGVNQPLRRDLNDNRQSARCGGDGIVQKMLVLVGWGGVEWDGMGLHGIG